MTIVPQLQIFGVVGIVISEIAVGIMFVVMIGAGKIGVVGIVAKIEVVAIVEITRL